MKTNNCNLNENLPLTEKIKELRDRSLDRKKRVSYSQKDKPVAFWIKRDRLLNEIGKEFTIILRTRGCKWALSETGGCSMCGYVQDASLEKVEPKDLIKQFDYAFHNKIEEIERDEANYVVKIFNSGSFFDENEIPEEVKMHIYETVNTVKKIKEFVVESRVEYADVNKLNEAKKSLKDKYIEIGIGIETVDDYIRNHYINKGVLFQDFQNAVQNCKEIGIGVKAYLLFKPLFLTETAAIEDCIRSIKSLIDLKINSISVNPVNVQKGTLAEYLWHQNKYRPPWFYSLMKCFKKALNEEDLKCTRILCDPSGAGTIRGIHNCLKRECNENMINALEKFVLSQNLRYIRELEFNCDCYSLYLIQRYYC